MTLMEALQEPEAEINLQFFLRWGVGGAGDGCEYVIVAKNGEHHDRVRFMRLGIANFVQRQSALSAILQVHR